jgi:hypothetical protein
MLFTPWRNEQVDLMGAEEHYEDRRDENMKSVNK